MIWKHQSLPIVSLIGICICSALAVGQDKRAGTRSFDPDEILAPPGYRIEAYATLLHFPIDITFGDKGEIYLAEAGAHFFGIGPKTSPPAQIVELRPTGHKRVVYDHTVPLKDIRNADSSDKMPEGLIPPITGVTFHEGKLYVSHRSRYSVLDPKTGDFKTIVNGLPCWGEFLNAKPIFDRQGKMVFFVSTQGNSGIIDRHWMQVINALKKPHAHEVPGENVILAGKNFPVPVEDPSTPQVNDAKMTGVFVPLGTTTDHGEVIQGKLICNGAFYRCNPDGSDLERIAWGFRSSMGYRFSPSGELFCTQNSANPMPPRGLWYDYESIYRVQPGEWYGWPDFFSGLPITSERFAVHKGKGEFVLTPESHQKLLRGKPLPMQPVIRLTPHSAAQGMVFGREEFGISSTSILVAEMGTISSLFKGRELYPSGVQTPHEAAAGSHEDDPPPTALPVPEDVNFNWLGFKVQLIDLKNRRADDFLRNRIPGPATAGNGGGMERPLQLEWGPDGALYVVDFGVISLTKMGLKAHGHTGVVWRVSRANSD